MRSLLDLPKDLPQPVDDGAARHLMGLPLPSLTLEGTGGPQSLSKLDRAILFVFPRAGSPLEPNANEELWDLTPGARGCTPQSCGFRDLGRDFKALKTSIFGLSVQRPKVLREIAVRNELPFPLLSDEDLALGRALGLPTFDFEGERLLKRMALYIEDGQIRQVFYPVFPPNENARTVLSWLTTHKIV
jgi:peroxiredoxin